MMATTREQLEKRLAQMESAFEQANIRMGEAVWSVYSGEGEADLDEAQAGIGRVLDNKADRAMVEAWFSRTDSATSVLRRRLEVWRNCFHGSAVENDPSIYTLKNRLQRRIASFTFPLAGRSVPRSELQRILRQEPDREVRHQAWRSLSELATANRADLRQLIELRNRKARELGYRGYVDLILKVQEVDPHWLSGILEKISGECRPAYESLIRSLAARLGLARLAPWDVAFAMRNGFQLPDAYFPAAAALERLRSTARNLGFAVDGLPIRTLVRDIPFGGYNVAVRIPDDTRFLVNPTEGQGFYTTTFHEFGHSLQAVFTTIPWPILKEYEWVTGGHTPAYSEGMAEVMGDFARRPDWLRETLGVSGDEIERYVNKLLPAQMLMRVFELLLNMRVELAAYVDPSQDMARRERELTEEIRLLEYREEDPPQWEANTWYTSYPVYWQNYILASLISSQVHEALNDRFGPRMVSSPDVSGYLRESYYEAGNSLPWTRRIACGTGKALSPEAYLKRVISPDGA